MIACGTEPRNAADALVKAANVAGAEIVRVYGEELISCVNEAGTLQESKDCRAGVEARWQPVQDAWKKLQAVQQDSAAALTAYCNLRKVAPLQLMDVGCEPR